MAKTDDQGNFVFEHLRPGEYFLSGLAEWYFGDDVRYQWACERITVGHGQSVRIKLAKNPQSAGQPILILGAFK